MMTKIRPLHDRVVVKRLDAESKSAGGIVIPDTAGEKPDQGEVVAIGKGKILEDGKGRPLDVKVGDRILFGKYSGQAVKVEGTEDLGMREDDIMGVVAKEIQRFQFRSEQCLLKTYVFMIRRGSSCSLACISSPTRSKGPPAP